MPKWLVQVLLIVGLIGSGYLLHTTAQERAVEKAREEAKAGMVEESIHTVASIRLKELEDETALLRSNYNRTLRMLNSRPARGPAPAASSSCTGAQLYREDGEFLAGEAARAEKVRLERDYWYEQYETARKLLEKAKHE